MGNLLNSSILGLNFEKQRLTICKACPLYYKLTFLRAKCNSNLFLNPETNLISRTQKDGFKSGCGCDILIKIKSLDNVCPLRKW